MDRINVTKTFLPPIHEYEQYIEQIWSSSQVTNQGPLVLEFEALTKDYLGVENFHFVTSGTIALQIALKSLGIEEGEIITTPFTYVATTSAILWERCTPVFVDIDPDSFCIDPSKIEAAITNKTKAIMPVHVFGHPCDIEAIDSIARCHNLKVIYDGAQAFGVQYKGKQLLNNGDISICSFHATKLFHTIEGGCVIAKNAEVDSKLELMKRFGHNGYDHQMLGINAKSSEVNAAMGLCNLNYIDQNIQKRKKITELYNSLIGQRLQRPKISKDTIYNYSYYPVIFDSEKKLLETEIRLNTQNIFPRRYFYPSLNKLRYLDGKQACAVSEDISKRILCLPIYPELKTSEVKRICETILL